jgi:hypothetical protein
MAVSCYTIRYCYRPGTPQAALIVADEQGDAYLVGRHGFCCRWPGAHRLEDVLPRLRAQGWTPAPPGSACTLADLRGRLGADAPWPELVYSS